MLDFKDEVLQFKYNGEVYELNFPKVKDLKKFQKDYKENEESIDVMIDFLVDLGGEREVIENLSAKALKAISEKLAGSEKK
jgi:hypothetical protein